MAENEVEYTKPTSQLDAERRLAAEKGETPEGDDAPRSYAVEGNDLSQYVGVNPEYQNYADETHKPAAFEGVEAELVERQKAALSTDVPEGVDNKLRVPKTETVETDEPERVEPKQATYNIPAVTSEGDVSGDKPVVQRETRSESDKKGGRQAKE